MNDLLFGVGRLILQAGAVEIHDVDGGEQPFLYSTGNWGPGYVMIKGLCGYKSVFRMALHMLAMRVAEQAPHIDFVNGNATGGMVPGWVLSEQLEHLLGHQVPYVYMRGSRKAGGHKELITGLDNNPWIEPGNNGLVVEELVNFAGTTCNSAQNLREVGYDVTHAACILSYNNPKATEALATKQIQLISLLTLPQLLDIAEECETHDFKLIAAYRLFLSDPLGWQAERGLEPKKEGGTL